MDFETKYLIFLKIPYLLLIKTKRAFLKNHKNVKHVFDIF